MVFNGGNSATSSQFQAFYGTLLNSRLKDMINKNIPVEEIAVISHPLKINMPTSTPSSHNPSK